MSTHSISSDALWKTPLLFKRNLKRYGRKPIIEIGDYGLFTTQLFRDIYKLAKLRYKVFHHEYQLSTSKWGVDFDSYDLQCHHLALFHKNSQNVIGNYRLKILEDVNESYSSQEFNLNNIQELPGRKMELGRACIDPKHRNGKTLDLLWRGIAYYAHTFNIRYLFGCSSVKGTPQNRIEPMVDYLKSKEALLDNSTPPREAYNPLTIVDKNLGKPLETPRLLKSYISAGAKVSQTPAYDSDFNCFDFFTLLDLNEVNPVFKKRYFQEDK